MNKCVSCKADLPSQTRFCGVCGTKQPSGTDAGEADNIETVLSNPHEEKPPVDSSPSPPQPPQNASEMQRGDAGISPSGQQEHKAQANSPAEQLNNPPSNPGQPLQTSYGEAQQFPLSQQLQQPHSSYQQAQPPYGEYQQQPSSPYNFQQTPPPSPYGNYQQQPYGNYQQPPQPQQPYGNYPSMPLYGDYQAPPQVYGNYQQTPPPVFQPSGMHVTDTMTDGRPNTAGIKPVPTGTPPKAPEWRKWAIIAVVVVLILAGSGILFVRFVVYPPLTPTINVTSKYYDKGTPAGATDTTLQVTGKQFTANSAITFLLDNTTIKTQAVSDTSGNVSTDLKVTSDWSVGPHKLTARDANGNTTNTSAAISIVQQGNDSTPGPNGAPSNDATFKVNITAQMHRDMDNSRYTDNYVLTVTGRPDPQGGTVCSPNDDGSPKSGKIYDSSGNTFPMVSTFSCNGTYTGGTINYDETLQLRSVTFSNSDTCTLAHAQQSFTHITGKSTSPGQFSGDITLSGVDPTQFSCSGGGTLSLSGATGTWTGTVGNS